MLARLRMSHVAVRGAILRLDDQQLSVDNLNSLKHFCPTQDEIDALRTFEGDVTTLTAADQFFNELVIFPRLAERLTSMLYRRKLEMEMEELRPDLTILRSAAAELRDSQRFKKLLQTVLAIGNTLNASTFRGGATGFSLDSLLKLRDTKSASASPATPTLLHYLVRVIHRNDSALIEFLDETPHLEAASRISTSTVMQTVHSLVSGAAQVQEELETLQSLGSLPSGDSFIEVMQQFLKHATPAMNALSTLGKTLDEELKSTISYFGEDPAQTKPEELFDLVAQFSSALSRANVEVKTFDEKAAASAPQSAQISPLSNASASLTRLPQTPPPRTPTKNSSLTPSHLGSVERGRFDSAIRELRNGTSRRQRSTADRDRPLSRIFLSS